MSSSPTVDILRLIAKGVEGAVEFGDRVDAGDCTEDEGTESDDLATLGVAGDEVGAEDFMVEVVAGVAGVDMDMEGADTDVIGRKLSSCPDGTGEDVEMMGVAWPEEICW